MADSIADFINWHNKNGGIISIFLSVLALLVSVIAIVLSKLKDLSFASS